MNTLNYDQDKQQDQRCVLCEPYNPSLVVLNFVVCSRARVERAPVLLAPPPPPPPPVCHTRPS